ncbi:hypothetical protein FNV43_RR14815 [Rhamnella rubrinervis]|uniref:Uncharacterized protein n=1 Tax=Rhamnella rubrinervis TaxID=2594499 RepID=A0A8K0H3L6_9ROSA|nr:hypothetical protein FNV43_RR14815 [Rhamnella rubrinervis]
MVMALDEPRFELEEHRRNLSSVMSYVTAKNAIDTKCWILAGPIQHYILGPCFRKDITSEVQCIYDEQGPEKFPYEWEFGASHEIDSQLVDPINHSWAKMSIGPYLRFNSHPIIKDITKAEDNFDIDDFLIDHNPTTQNSDHGLTSTGL